MPENQAAITIQTMFRAYRVRKQYAIKQLPSADLQNYKVRIAGNEPEIDIAHHPVDNEQIALIGTSGFRSVELACKLNPDQTKLIIIDNSRQVITFWRDIKNLIKNSREDEFITSLFEYIKENKEHIGNSTSCEINYINRLVAAYGIDKIIKIVDKYNYVSMVRN